MKGLIGKKIGMTQIFDDNGKAIPVTVIVAGPCTVTQVKTLDRDGYDALQLGIEELKKGKKIPKPLEGHFKKNELSCYRYLREFKFDNITDYKTGQKLNVKDIFKTGELVDVVGTSKGKGFAGGVKRWGFSGGPRTHGSMHHRKAASGGSTDAARTFKGKKRPGRMGGKRTTVQGLKVLKVYSDKHLLLVKGSVPGAKNEFLLIKESVKK